MTTSVIGAIKCRKAFLGCVLCGKKVQVGEIYSRIETGARVHRACGLRHMGITVDPLTNEEVA